MKGTITQVTEKCLYVDLNELLKAYDIDPKKYRVTSAGLDACMDRGNGTVCIRMQENTLRD
jgi:hypothetical protein